jgi:hypothetical protein
VSLQEVTEVVNPVNIMANKTYVVTLKETPPYTMLKEEVSEWGVNVIFKMISPNFFAFLTVITTI